MFVLNANTKGRLCIALVRPKKGLLMMEGYIMVVDCRCAFFTSLSFHVLGVAASMVGACLLTSSIIFLISTKLPFCVLGKSATNQL